MASNLEELMAFQLRVCDWPEPVREFHFIPGRKFRADFAWPGLKLLLEVEGGTWNGGRHTSGKGFGTDCEKYNLASIQGWRVIRVTGEHIKSGQALAWLEAAMRLPFQ